MHAKQFISWKTRPTTDLPKSQKNFFESRVFDMILSSYMKHKYFFPRPKDNGSPGVLEEISTERDLGITIDNEMSFETHCT